MRTGPVCDYASRALGVVSLAALLAAAPGCARGGDAEARNLAALRDEVARMRASSERLEARVEKLELARGDGASAADAGRDDDAQPPTPGDLRVVKLEPGGKAPSPPGDDASAYDAALAALHARRYDAATEAFAAFLVRWPDHPLAGDALYWRGEAFFAQGDYAHAATQFEGVLARFPLGDKAADALLKLGLCQARLGRAQVAEASFERLRREYPRSAAAHHIPPSRAP